MVMKLELTRTKDTKNYAKFEVAAPANGKPAAFGTVYLPLDQAVGIASVTVLVREV